MGSDDMNQMRQDGMTCSVLRMLSQEINHFLSSTVTDNKEQRKMGGKKKETKCKEKKESILFSSKFRDKNGDQIR